MECDSIPISGAQPHGTVGHDGAFKATRKAHGWPRSEPREIQDGDFVLVVNTGKMASLY